MKGVVPDSMTRIGASASQGIHGAAAVDTSRCGHTHRRTANGRRRYDGHSRDAIRCAKAHTDALGHATRLTIETRVSRRS